MSEPERIEERVPWGVRPPEVEALRVISNGYAALPHMFMDEREAFLALVRALSTATWGPKPSGDEP